MCRLTEGHGATRNGQPIRCRSTADLRDAIGSLGDFATGSDASNMNVARLQAVAALAVWTERVRMRGSAVLGLAFVASGLTDGAVIFGGKEWDIAAGTIISREAGATVFQAADGSHHRSQSGVPRGAKRRARQGEPRRDRNGLSPLDSLPSTQAPMARLTALRLVKRKPGSACQHQVSTVARG